MVASASVKVAREQIEQLARLLRVDVRLSESGAALFRRCLERVSELATQETLDRLDRATGRARVVLVEGEIEGSNAEALAALRAFRSALGGAAVEEEASAREGAPRSAESC